MILIGEDRIYSSRTFWSFFPTETFSSSLPRFFTNERENAHVPTTPKQPEQPITCWPAASRHLRPSEVYRQLLWFPGESLRDRLAPGQELHPGPELRLHAGYWRGNPRGSEGRETAERGRFIMRLKWLNIVRKYHRTCRIIQSMSLNVWLLFSVPQGADSGPFWSV